VNFLFFFNYVLSVKILHLTFTAEAKFHFQGSRYGVYGAQSGNIRALSHSIMGFPLQLLYERSTFCIH
jgi:hypothetical protein